jgi:hypothetical protein
MSASTHQSYLEQLGIAERPLESSIAPSRRHRGQLGHRGAKTIAVITEGDLFKLRSQIFWLFATDEERDGRTVLIKRGLSTVARIECATEALAWNAERICAGIRFRRGAE